MCSQQRWLHQVKIQHKNKKAGFTDVILQQDLASWHQNTNSTTVSKPGDLTFAGLRSLMSGSWMPKFSRMTGRFCWFCGLKMARRVHCWWCCSHTKPKHSMATAVCHWPFDRLTPFGLFNLPTKTSTPSSLLNLPTKTFTPSRFLTFLIKTFTPSRLLNFLS